MEQSRRPFGEATLFRDTGSALSRLPVCDCMAEMLFESTSLSFSMIVQEDIIKVQVIQGA